MPQTKEDIGRKIRQLRNKRGVTVKDLADMVGMSAGYLSEVERGKSAVSGELLMRVGSALQTTAGVLLGEEPDSEDRNTVEIPEALSEAAKAEGWSYRTTFLLLKGKLSLTARRADEEAPVWQTHDWIGFYNQVKDFIQD